MSRAADWSEGDTRERMGEGVVEVGEGRGEGEGREEWDVAKERW